MERHPLYIKLQEAIEAAPTIPPCQVTDPEIWFAEKGDWQATYMAKELCSKCPVKDLCLQYALETNEYSGVWGGVTPRERMRMRAARERLKSRNLV